MPKSLWVADLIISDRTRAKITGLHKIDPFDVRQAIVATAGLRYKYQSDQPRGPRYYVEAWVGNDRVLAVLYPIAHPVGDVYALGSVYREPRGLDAIEDKSLPAGGEDNAAGGISRTADDESSATGVNTGDQNVN